MHVWSDLYFALPVPLLPLIKEDLDLSFTEVGLLRSVFAGSSAVLQVPAGLLAETAGEFWLLILGNMWVGFGLVGMGLSPVFLVLLAASFFGGLGGGAQHPLASSMVSRAYDTQGRSTAVGTVNFAGDLGKMAAPLVGGAIAVAFGWRTALLAIGIAGTAFMVMSALGRRSVDGGKPPASAGRAANESDGTTRMGGFVTLSGIGFLDSATRGAALAFLPFVMVARDMGGGQVSAMLVLLFAGGAAGKFVVGWLGDRYGTVSLIWGTKALTAIMLVLSLVAPSPLMAPLMVALGVGLNGTSSILYATVAEFVPPNRRARQYGFFYTTNEGGSVLAPLVYGLIADLFSLNVSIVAMGLATAAIMPVSLSLRRHLRAVQPAATVGEHEPEF
jgi:MFS family permease